LSSKDFIEKDYYATLGVSKDAKPAEIKKAYRKLAREHHPDANAGDDTRFKEISEAYDVLSDEKRRTEYDEMRALFAGGGFRPGGVPGGNGYATGGQGGGFRVNLDDLFGAGGGGGFGDMLGGLFGGAGQRSASRTRQARRGADIESEVTLGFADSVTGVTLPLRLSSPHTCPTCAGSGAAPGTTPRVCPTCGGAGMTTRNEGGFGFSEPCRDCRATGRIIDTPCPDCGGTGQATRERTITVRIPAGVKDGQRIRLKGKGSPGNNGGPAGDLFVVVHVTPHPVFGRKGNNLTVTVPVTYAEAALGAEIAVPTLDGSVTLRVPAGTSSGQTFRVKGRGVPAKSAPGDLLVTVTVDVPKRLSESARKAVEALAKSLEGDPRAQLFERIRS
jgi:molecular chaperone DnaJ